MRGTPEVIFEITRIGAYAKATAVHAKTGLEVSVVGPANSIDSVLQNMALRKLERALGVKLGPAR